MKIEVATKYPKKLDAVIVRVAEGEKKLASASQLDDSVRKAVTVEIKRRDFQGKIGETFSLRLPSAMAEYVIVLGIGTSFELESFRKTTAAAVRAGAGINAQTMAMAAPGDKVAAREAAQANTEGVLLASYKFNKYKEPSRTETETVLTIVARDEENRRAVAEGIARGKTTARSVVLARDLVNEPPSTMTPTDLAEAAKRVAQETGLDCEVWDQAKIEKIGLAAFLAVAKGSDQPPKLIRLEYAPAGATKNARTLKAGPLRGRALKHVVLVGKGITFDSGGLNLKPSRGGSLEDMKMDMAGGAAVIGAMSALGALGVKHKVTGYIAATENLLGGSAYKPGDVVRAYNGKTIEVLNTDAEGRLTLADVLSYAEKNDKPDAIIDLATLTATEVSLGLDYAAVFGDAAITEPLIAAGETAGEKVWPFPLPEEYQETVKGRIADLRNTGTDRGYSINGAVFLRNFVTEKTPWSHVDIGSPAMSEKDRGYLQSGATGFGVRLLLEYLRNE